MKHLIAIILLTGLSLKAVGQQTLNGKTFQALTRIACEKTTNGGCDIRTHCVMAFEKDSVLITHHTKAHCTTRQMETQREENQEERKYAWHMQKDTIIIHKFTDYSPLIAGQTGLLGHKNGNAEQLVFDVLAK